MNLFIQVVQILLLVSALEGNFIKSRLKNKRQDSSSTEEEEAICKRPYYRPYDGYCNNLKHPTWGTPEITYNRLFSKYSYRDGLCAFANLPNPRKISLQGFVHLSGTEDPLWTLNTISWGQLIAHDTTLTYGVPETGEADNLCSCINGTIVGNPSNNCALILIPEDDPYNAPEGKQCMSFVRTESTCDRKSYKPAEQINGINSYIDASFTFGNSEEEAKSLRSYKNGKLLCQTRHGRIYPPQSENNTCHSYSRSKDTLCTRTGDPRSNQNPYIGLAQIIMLRYHNNIAEKLCTIINPHWNDEKCFQEARRIVIASAQHITYHEFLTFILGASRMTERNMLPLNIKQVFHNVYDENMDPTCINEHAAAAYRSLHSGIRGHIPLLKQDRKHFGVAILSKNFDDISLFLRNKTELGLATGCSTQLQWKLDRYHDDQVTQKLFNYDNLLGQDLVALDLSRGRDHGLAPYAVAVKECGLGDPKSFDDFRKYISKENVELLKRLYDRPDQVELRVGGQFETPLKDALTGPTFNCIMLKQFERTKRGDYYWYENEKQHYPFTWEQLKSIKKGATISSLICNQVDGMKRIQKQGFKKPNNHDNPIVDCKDIPTIDLTLWKEEYNYLNLGKIV